MKLRVDLSDQPPVWEPDEYTSEEKTEQESPELENHYSGLGERQNLA